MLLARSSSCSSDTRPATALSRPTTRRRRPNSCAHRCTALDAAGPAKHSEKVNMSALPPQSRSGPPPSHHHIIVASATYSVFVCAWSIIQLGYGTDMDGYPRFIYLLSFLFASHFCLDIASFYIVLRTHSVETRVGWLRGCWARTEGDWDPGLAFRFNYWFRFRHDIFLPPLGRIGSWSGRFSYPVMNCFGLLWMDRLAGLLSLWDTDWATGLDWVGIGWDGTVSDDMVWFLVWAISLPERCITEAGSLIHHETGCFFCFAGWLRVFSSCLSCEGIPTAAVCSFLRGGYRCWE